MRPLFDLDLFEIHELKTMRVGYDLLNPWASGIRRSSFHAYRFILFAAVQNISSKMCIPFQHVDNKSGPFARFALGTDRYLGEW